MWPFLLFTGFNRVLGEKKTVRDTEHRLPFIYLGLYFFLNVRVQEEFTENSPLFTFTSETRINIVKNFIEITTS